MTFSAPQDPASAAVLAARRKLEGISSDAATKLSASSQEAIDAGKKAAQAHQELGERIKKIEGRVREIAANRAAEQAKARGPGEIKLDEEDSGELPDEYRDIVAHYPGPQPTAPAAAPAAVDRQPEPTAAAWQPGGAVDDGWIPADELTPRAETQPSQESDPWQVQAGRFGRRKQSDAPKQAPKNAAPAPKSAGTERRQPVSDDDYFENDSWLE